MSVCADQACVPDKSGVDPRREGKSRNTKQYMLSNEGRESIKRKNEMSASKQQGTSCIQQNTLEVLTRDANLKRIGTIGFNP